MPKQAKWCSLIAYKTKSPRALCTEKKIQNDAIGCQWCHKWCHNDAIDDAINDATNDAINDATNDAIDDAIEW